MAFLDGGILARLKNIFLTLTGGTITGDVTISGGDFEIGSDQNFDFYGVGMGTSNYQRVRVSWSSDDFYIQTAEAGTETMDDLFIGTGTGGDQLRFRTNGITQWNVTFTDGDFRPNTDDAHDLGSSSYRIKQLYISDLIDMKEETTPPGAQTDRAIIWSEDNGSGKTRLMVQFQTGAAQQIAIEP